VIYSPRSFPDMDEQEVVRELTRKGVVVTPEILSRIRSGKEPLPDHVAAPKKQPTARLSVKIVGPPTKEKMSVSDFTSYYNKKYNTLRDMLVKHISPVSINKAVDVGGEVCVIGMVKERTRQGFVIEDTTGEIDIVGVDDVREDDVIGVRGDVKEGRLMRSEIVWPDVPETNQPTRLHETSLLLTTSLGGSMLGAANDFSVVFVAGQSPSGLPESTMNRVFGDLPNPCWATIKKDGKEFMVFVYKPKDAIQPDEARKMLRRRHLSPERVQISSTTDPYVIDPIPDIFWVISNTRHSEQYRGVSLIMSREGEAVKVDASTGEVYFATPGARTQPT
jgi:DNA polymerase II small subunit/DNA polymerase delta subunit B